jgi:hypothetical protein
MSAEGARAAAAVQAVSLPESQNRPGPAENVDRIREILFGSQMREYAQRFGQIEERLMRETGELRAEVRRRLDSLEAYARQEVGALADRLNTERSERAESAERTSREFGDSLRSLERRLLQSDEQVSKDLRELRQLTLERHKSLSEELTQSIAVAGSLLDRRLDELRASAVDRFAFANLLAELALRLWGESLIPGNGDSSDAGADT